MEERKSVDPTKRKHTGTANRLAAGTTLVPDKPTPLVFAPLRCIGGFANLVAVEPRKIRTIRNSTSQIDGQGYDDLSLSRIRRKFRWSASHEKGSENLNCLGWLIMTRFFWFMSQSIYTRWIIGQPRHSLGDLARFIVRFSFLSFPIPLVLLPFHSHPEIA